MAVTEQTTRSSTPVVIKVGGRIANSRTTLQPILLGLGQRANQRAPTILVHGGGDELTTFSRRLGIEPRFERGVRITSPEEMPIVEMVLGGAANTALVRRLQSSGVPSVGLTGCDGASVVADAIATDDGAPTCTGRVTRVSGALFHTLIGGGYLPVLASVAMNRDGAALNVNADEVAFEIAKAVRAEALVFISDTEGIMKDGAPIAAITPHEVEREIAAGVIDGGMVVKARAAVDALQSGVTRIMIGGCDSAEAFAALIDGTLGTRIAYE